MNKEYVLYNLREASEQLTSLIQDLESDSEYDYGDLVIDMSHLYHHINTAWNARDESDVAVAECNEGDFNRWRQMPPSDELLLES
ncbi:MAG: hypothetical protein AAGF57_20985 [Pseudomonadota bacterium]